MEKQTIFLLIGMFVIVLISSLYGAINAKAEQEEEKKNHAKNNRANKSANTVKGASSKPAKHSALKSDDSESSDSESDTDTDTDTKNDSPFKKAVNTTKSFLKETFSKWGNTEGGVLVPTSKEIDVDSPTYEGMKGVRSEFQAASETSPYRYHNLS